MGRFRPTICGAAALLTVAGTLTLTATPPVLAARHAGHHAQAGAAGITGQQQIPFQQHLARLAARHQARLAKARKLGNAGADMLSLHQQRLALAAGPDDRVAALAQLNDVDNQPLTPHQQRLAKLHAQHQARLAKLNSDKQSEAAKASGMHQARLANVSAWRDLKLAGIGAKHTKKLVVVKTRQRLLHHQNLALQSGSIIEAATAFRGTRYVFGGTSRSGFDCSGFTRFILGKSEGVDLPRTAMEQYYNGAKVRKNDMLPGDLVFFKNTYRSGISHVGIFIGQGKFVHACNERRGVTVDNLGDAYYASHFAGARRVVVDREAGER